MGTIDNLPEQNNRIFINKLNDHSPSRECLQYFGSKDEAISVKLDKISEKMDLVVVKVTEHDEKLKYLTLTNDQTINDLKPIKKFVNIINAIITLGSWFGGTVGTIWILFQIGLYIITNHLLGG